MLELQRIYGDDAGNFAPVITRFNQEVWDFGGGGWTRGNWPGILWRLHEANRTPIPNNDDWATLAAAASVKSPVLADDLSINNLFVQQSWYAASGDPQRLDDLAAGANSLVAPVVFDGNGRRTSGRYFPDIGVIGFNFGFEGDSYWHAFIDHAINVEHLFWCAANVTSAPTEAVQPTVWHDVAVSHLLNIGAHMGANRDPGSDGSWQRGFYQDDATAANYTEFVGNGVKQGFDSDTTWSRGHAWWLYALTQGVAYSDHPELRNLLREHLQYHIDNVPANHPAFAGQPNRDWIPAWDYDFAKEHDLSTERDTSAAAIITAGLVRLLVQRPNDPEAAVWRDVVDNTLRDLTAAPYLSHTSLPSILAHGATTIPTPLRQA